MQRKPPYSQILAFFSVLWCARALAFPTSLNVMPTADLVESGSLRLEVENDGYSRLFASGCESYLLTQVGISPRLEAGLDFYHYNGKTEPALNAKYLLSAEGRYPQAAIGVLDVCRGLKPFWYLALARDVGPVRLHAGAARSGSSHSALLGAELEVGRGLYLLSDWRSGPEGYATAGIYWEQRGSAVNVAIGFPNATGDSRLVLLNISRTLSFAH
jgi:hypothetical protein